MAPMVPMTRYWNDAARARRSRAMAIEFELHLCGSVEVDRHVDAIWRVHAPPRGARPGARKTVRRSRADRRAADAERAEARRIRLLHEQQVAVSPGSAFGPSGEGYVRAALATSYEQLEEALVRIERFLDSL